MSEPTFVSKINLYSVYHIHEESHNQRLNFFHWIFLQRVLLFFLSREYFIFIHYMK